MEFAARRPPAPLDASVDSITCFSGFAPRHHREKLIPDGFIELIVDLSEVPKKLYASETGPASVDFRRAWISGMQRRWIVIEAQPESSLLVVRFRPGGAYPLLAHDAATLTDAVFDLEAVLGRLATSLRDRVLEAPGGTARSRVLAAEAWLCERIGGSRPPPVVAHVVGRLADPAGLRIGALADDVGLSGRHLRNLFDRWIGVSPKQYARIRRFGRMLQALGEDGAPHPELRGARHSEPDWAALAGVFGYADQSHLSHEFRAFAGITPGEYVAAYRGLANYLPITLPAGR